ncbi:MAG TPA: 16S rRNA (cytosine(967)-C(5))-methyltransferase RsmB [Gemmatimonadales bacterium]|nr:16S rRNA (cytosine(967)-C(5))-methyltransferase RsmB [Gemmatimonadales bacterium]
MTGAPTGLAARRAALAVLTRVRQGTPFEQALGDALHGLDEADRRLTHELAAGVFRRQRDLDARLIPLVFHGWGSVSPALRDLLRLGAYQLTALDRVPPHAAVSTAVDLARAQFGEKEARFVNAILRNLGGRAAPPPVAADPALHLASLHSHPDWLVKRWVQRFGAAETEQLLEWNNTVPSLVVQPARVELAELQRTFFHSGVPSRLAPYGAGLVLGQERPADLPGFADGAFMVQDPAQQLVSRFVAPPTGAVVYDACAAPGGKAMALSRIAGLVIAGDLKKERAKRLSENLARAGSGASHVIVASAAQPPIRPADVVLLDAPCLGTGTFARHPDARWRVTRDALKRISLQQGELLEAAAASVRPGGWLVYATCSLEPEENEEQVRAFLARHPEMSRDPGTTIPAELLSPEGDLLLLPQRHAMDGAYAARLRKAAA